eukprot:6286251-Alexandrium_andersonii.AAC.1
MPRTSNIKWDRAQAKKLSKTVSRDYRVLLRASGWFSDPSMHAYASMISFDHWWRPLPEAACTS